MIRKMPPLDNYTEDPVKRREQEKADWKVGVIVWWDDEKGKGYIQPLKTIDNSPYGKGQYYFTYITLTEREYSPKVGDEVKFRTRREGLYLMAEIMEVLK